MIIRPRIRIRLALLQRDWTGALKTLSLVFLFMSGFRSGPMKLMRSLPPGMLSGMFPLEILWPHVDGDPIIPSTFLPDGLGRDGGVAVGTKELPNSCFQPVLGCLCPAPPASKIRKGTHWGSMMAFCPVAPKCGVCIG